MQPTRPDADPVFVDHSGRRRRLFAIAGSAGACALLLAIGALVAGFTGVGPGAAPRLPGGVAPGAAVVPAPSTTTPGQPTSPGGSSSPGQQPSPGASASSSVGASGPAAPAPLTSASSRRNAPTQTPSHPGKPK